MSPSDSWTWLFIQCKCCVSP
uniref:Uncharacterized protein n=1 Tax=Anguilla anguilla TaxID=7936 RepID=A0A0E9U1L4_ANGAN